MLKSMVAKIAHLCTFITEIMANMMKWDTKQKNTKKKNTSATFKKKSRKGRKDSANIFNISSQPNVNNLCCVCFFMINIYLFTTLQFASQSSFQRLHGQEKPSQTSEFTFKSLSAENVLSLLETAHYCYLLQKRNEILMRNNPGMDSFLLTLWKSK